MADGAVRSRGRFGGWTVVVAVTLGVGGALAMGVGSGPEVRFVTVNGAAQSLASVVTPLVGILLARSLRRSSRSETGTAWVRACGRAVVIAVAVAAASWVVTALVVPMSARRWELAGPVAVASMPVQIAPALVGIGLGLVVGRAWAAFALSIVLPLGLFALLGLTPGGAVARPWLTPYAVATRLLAGDGGSLAWLQWAVVTTLWAGGLTLLGRRLRSGIR